MKTKALAHWRPVWLSSRAALWLLFVLAGMWLQGLQLQARALPQDEDSGKIITIDHQVPHISTVPANAGQSVNLFVRERVASNRAPGKPVLMIHGLSVPVLPGGDLRSDHYDWALWLAQAGGLDVFLLDFQGSGLSPRPQMDNPCNVPKLDQQTTLIPNPLSETCNPSYPFQLINSQSDWSELDTVVDYIRNLRAVDKVALVSWSQGSFRIGPYSVQHPEKVESLLFYAPIFNKAFRSGTGVGGFDPPVDLPQPGTPMSLRTRSQVMGLWNSDIKNELDAGCEAPVEDGIQDVIWNAIMDNDSLGRTWGPPPADAPAGSPPEGVMRVRTPTLWGWNLDMAHRITVPVLLIRGEFDTGDGGRQDLTELYAEIQHAHKLWFTVVCAGHRMVWERQRKVLHHISKEWLTHEAVEGFTNGKFFVDSEGNLFPQ